MNKKILFPVLIMCVIVAFCLTGCSSGTQKAKPAIQPKINMEDITWELKNGIVNGDRLPVFDYTNNTDYPIIGFEVKFVTKKDLSKEDLNKYNNIKEKANAMDHDITETTMELITEKLCAPGETVKNQRINLDGTIELMTEQSAYEAFQPDTMSIAYLKGNNAYVAYYDYQNKETTYENKKAKINKWSNSKLANTIPKPNADYYAVTTDEDDEFDVTVYNVDQDFFKGYADACKEQGYTVDADLYDDSFDASDKAKNNLSIYYSPDEGNMTISLYNFDIDTDENEDEE